MFVPGEGVRAGGRKMRVASVLPAHVGIVRVVDRFVLMIDPRLSVETRERDAVLGASSVATSARSLR